jgi:glycosyltransferase involved in cell wall biosynthesis
LAPHQRGPDHRCERIAAEVGTYASWVSQAVQTPQTRTAVNALRDLLPARVRRLFARGKQAVVGTPAPWDGRMPFLADAVQRTQTRRPRSMGGRPRIVHLIGTLGPGGAERQLCNVAIASKRLGHDVRVILMWEPEGDHGHYLHLLHDAGVEVSVAGTKFHPGFPDAVNRVPGALGAIRQIPAECWPVVVDVLGELLTDRPDVLHAWLDGSNVWGGMAGVLAQVPLIVLSTRNVNPSNFPSLDLPFFRQAYGELLQSPSVRLINNSHPGAEDYARWLGIPVERINVVLNGLELSRLATPTPAAVAAFRAQHDIPPGAPVIAGVFRLAEEKQPFTFLAVVNAVRHQRPDVITAIAGIGPLEQEMRDYATAHGFVDRVRFLGRLNDVSPLYAAASVTLLCSRKEGTPNVLLEAQWIGCPVVATRAGGAVDAVNDGVSGYLCDVGDVDALTGVVSRLLQSDTLRAKMSAEGPRFIGRRFSVERMVSETLNLYGITHEYEYGH